MEGTGFAAGPPASLHASARTAGAGRVGADSESGATAGAVCQAFDGGTRDPLDSILPTALFGAAGRCDGGLERARSVSSWALPLLRALHKRRVANCRPRPSRRSPLRSVSRYGRGGF